MTHGKIASGKSISGENKSKAIKSQKSVEINATKPNQKMCKTQL